MQGILKSSALVCVFIAVTNSAWAGSDSKARSLVEKAIKAHGGKKAKIKAQKMNVKGVMIFGGNKLKYTAVYTIVMPVKFRFDLAMDMDGKQIKLSAASDGKTAWEQMGSQVRVMEKTKAIEFQHNVYSMAVANLFPLRSQKYKLTLLGESKLGEATLIGIRAKRKGKRDVSLYFDKKTWLLKKTTTTIISEFTGTKQKQDVYFSEYRDQNGAKVFHKLVIQRDGKDAIIEEYSNQRNLPRVDASFFTKPKAGS
ncbi:MAG: hypothetical protein ACFCD0_14910 [Gemmataceae bacterium]